MALLTLVLVMFGWQSMTAKRRSDRTRQRLVDLSASERDVVMNDLRAGHDVQAIKSVRQFTGAGLGDAKRYVDGMKSALQS